MRYRKERLEELLKERLGDAILKDFLHDKGIITILSVQLDGKNENARIHIAVFPDEIKKEILGALNHKAGSFAHQLLKEIRIAKIPHLEFV